MESMRASFSRSWLNNGKAFSVFSCVAVIALGACKQRQYHEATTKDAPPQNATTNDAPAAVVKTFGPESTMADETGCGVLYMKPSLKARKLYSWSNNATLLTGPQTPEGLKNTYAKRLAKERLGNDAMTTYKSVGRANQVGNALYMAPDPIASHTYGKILVMSTLKAGPTKLADGSNADIGLFQFFNINDFPPCWLHTIKNKNVGAILYNWQSSKSDPWAIGVRNEELLDFSAGQTAVFDFRIGKRVAELNVSIDPATADDVSLVTAFGSYGHALTNNALAWRSDAKTSDDDVALQLIRAELWANPKPVSDAYTKFKADSPKLHSKLLNQNAEKDNPSSFGEILAVELAFNPSGEDLLALAAGLRTAGYVEGESFANFEVLRTELLRKWRSEPGNIEKGDAFLALIPKIRERWKKNTLANWDMDTSRMKLDPASNKMTAVTVGNIKENFDSPEEFGPIGTQVVTRLATKDGWMQVQFGDKMMTPSTLRGKKLWVRAQVFLPGERVFFGAD